MPRKKVIQAKDIVNDTRAGLMDDLLMKKYCLSATGLQSAFEKLVQSRIMTVKEIYGQPRSNGEDTVIVHDMRKLRRHFLTADVPIRSGDWELPECRYALGRQSRSCFFLRRFSRYRKSDLTRNAFGPSRRHQLINGRPDFSIMPDRPEKADRSTDSQRMTHHGPAVGHGRDTQL